MIGLIGYNLSQAKPKEPLTVISYNTRSFRKLFLRKEDNSKEQIAFRKRLDKKVGTIEIMCVQEFSAYPRTLQKIKELFDLSHFVKYKGRGTAIFSKYPIIKSGEIKFQNTGNSCLWIDVIIERKKVRVYSVHLESSKISSDAEELKEVVDLRKKETWSGIKGILGKYSRSTNTRVDQMAIVKKHIAQTPHPVIVCGDFNDTPISYVYHNFAQGLCDNFKEAGRGWGATYAGGIPMLRIDYIFTPKNDFKVYEHGILHEKYSDHYPVYSQLKLK